MKYDFDRVIDRKGTNSLKYDFTKERGMSSDLLPLWVADMDFQTAPEIINRVSKAVEHGIFGYTETKEDYFEAVYNWYKNNFSWKIKRKWLVKTPGVVFALAMAIKALTKEGESVLIQQPVYYPFSEVIKDNNRLLINSSLKDDNGHYQIDFEDFEKKIIDNDVRLFILCNPHNPVGRVWTKEELLKLGEICIKHHVKVVSDEIHSDFVYPGHHHTAFASLSDEIADITITCTSPSKSFNLAGLQISNIMIPNEEIRGKFKKEVAATGYSQVNALGIVACQAAYEEGGEWLDALRDYLWKNLVFVKKYLKENIPEVELTEPEGTYLIWLNFKKLELTNEELEDMIINKSKLWLDSGLIFGDEGSGYQRVNIACPRSILSKAMEQLKSGIEMAKGMSH